MKMYLVYRPLYTKIEGLPTMIQPGAKIRCNPIEAMCINTMQPMTLREMRDDLGKIEASIDNGNL